MSMEGQEGELITDVQCIEAMKAKDFERVRNWYDQEAAKADEGPSGVGRIRLTMRLADMQASAGFRDEAFDSFESAIMDAQGQGFDDLADVIQKIMRAHGLA